MAEPSPPPPHEIAPVSAIPAAPDDGGYGFEIPGAGEERRPLFGVREVSVEGMMATEAGQQVVHEHTETANDDKSKPGDEELYVVLSGRFDVRLDDEHREIGPGTFVFVGEPSTVRSFTALEPGSCVVAMGTNPGVEFIVSKFERE